MFVLRLSPKHVKAPGRSPRSGNVARTRRNTVKVLNTGSWSNLELLAIACAAWMEGSENPSFSATRQVTLLYCIQTVTMYARRSSSCCFGAFVSMRTDRREVRTYVWLVGDRCFIRFGPAHPPGARISIVSTEESSSVVSKESFPETTIPRFRCPGQLRAFRPNGGASPRRQAFE